MIIAIVNQKGGVAKTTSAITLAHGTALRGYKTLLIDLDPQGNVADGLGMEEGYDLFNWLLSDFQVEQVAVPSGRDRLDVIRSNKKTVQLREIISARSFRENALADALENQEESYEYVFLDCPPSIDILHAAALVAADYAIIPVKLDQFAVKGVIEVFESLAAMRRGSNRCQCEVMCILPTFFDQVTNESHDQLKNLADNYDGKVWMPVALDNQCRVANRVGKTLWEMQTHPRSLGGYGQCLDRIVRL